MWPRCLRQTRDRQQSRGNQQGRESCRDQCGMVLENTQHLREERSLLLRRFARAYRKQRGDMSNAGPTSGRI
jgi:hypothetical protein